MTIIEKIKKKSQNLPLHFQEEALHFIMILTKKAKTRKKKSENNQWAEFSLAKAMSGLEDDIDSEYSVSDLKERWK